MPAVDALLSQYESAKLRDYVVELSRPDIHGYQSNQDFIAEMVNYTQETLGAELGEAISEELRENPQVLTANHHGIDTFAQSTQSNLLFSMRKRIDGQAAKTIPVLACGSVPMNNLTYPRGLLIYAGTDASGENGICKLPIFPDSYKRKMVSVVAPFTAEMLGRSRIRAKKLFDDDKLGRPLESALNVVFDEFQGIGQAFPDYARQATVVNNRLWQRLFRGRSCPSELVYIELENIVCRLLKKDLFDKSSICYQLMFDPELRGRLIENLDGQRGCWQYDKLLQACSSSTAENDHSATNATKGTMFFWGVDSKGRKIPLCVKKNSNGTGVDLCGIDDGGQKWTIPFTPADIVQALQDGRLLPSIFTSYLLVSIARGVSCIGGYYQADYLPVMQKAVIETLRTNSEETVEAVRCRNLSSDLYLSGMQAIGLKSEGQMLPAGPLEIIASGGLDSEQYQQIGDITVLQAHIASLYDTIMDVVPQSGDYDRIRKQINRLVHDSVGRKIVTIAMD